MTPASSPDDEGPIEIPESVWQRVMFPKQETLEESRQWWSKEFGRELALADAAEIHKNLFGLFRMLAQIDARQRKIAAGQKVVDEEKVRKLRGEIYRLEDQIKAMHKMVQRWPKGEQQRLALEQAREALAQQLAAKRSEVSQELNCSAPKAPDAPAAGAP